MSDYTVEEQDDSYDWPVLKAAEDCGAAHITPRSKGDQVWLNIVLYLFLTIAPLVHCISCPSSPQIVRSHSGTGESRHQLRREQVIVSQDSALSLAVEKSLS
jgi:hypothetical protein